MNNFLHKLPGLLIVAVSTSIISCSDYNTKHSFQSQWSEMDVCRPWAGGEFWLNPLQAWEQKNGKLYCIRPGGDRNVVLLTGELTSGLENFTMDATITSTYPRVDGESVGKVTGIEAESESSGVSWVGFKLGIRGEFGDYRDDALKGRGLSAGWTSDGRLFIGHPSNSVRIASSNPDSATLRVSATYSDIEKKYELTLSLLHESSGVIENMSTLIDSSWLRGLLALTASGNLPQVSLDLKEPRPSFDGLDDFDKSAGGNTLYAFSDWTIEGPKFVNLPERSFGPILWTQYTLSGNTLKMSVQMAPVGDDNNEVYLRFDDHSVHHAAIDSLARNAIFRISDWRSERSMGYQVGYKSVDGKTYVYNGMIAVEPTDSTLVVASLSCADDVGFPHTELVQNVIDQDPDLLVFHGDQLYERVGGYGVERNSILDYQRKWYVFGWAFRELFRQKPVIIIPDDHDVFHGNLWGEGGKAADVSLGYGYDSQDSGGYKEPPEFVNMVHRAQTGHLPDPFDDTPVAQEISVYYTHMHYGGLSMAILGDRQWKSAPKPLFPAAEIENGWPQNIQWDATSEAHHPEAQLLGQRQEQFLEHWVRSWPAGAVFKMVISQSPFCNVATLPADIYHDKYVPGLKRYRKGEYPPDDRPVADFDSNGWPQNKRDLALSTWRKAFALHITGDQHLGSTGQYGIDEFGDAGYWISSPAISNLWPRRWFPSTFPESVDKSSFGTRNTGNFFDGFGNHMTIHAVANPYDLDRNPDKVYDKAPGYSIIRLNKNSRRMSLEVWPRWAGPAMNHPDNVPYEGWPVVIDQLDNFGRKPAGYLTTFQMDGRKIIRVFSVGSGELLYVLRPPEGAFTPFIFDLNDLYLVETETIEGIIEKWDGLSPKINFDQ